MRNNKFILFHNNKRIKNKGKKRWFFFLLLSTRSRTQLTNDPEPPTLATEAERFPSAVGAREWVMTHVV